MRKLLNTLYVSTEDAYLSLEGENVVIKQGEKELGRFPLHTLESIVSFSYAGASPALMGVCGERNVDLAFFTPHGRFLARSVGETRGNVLLRRTQYRMADDQGESIRVNRNFIFGKIYNCRQSIQRTRRDHGMRVNDAVLSDISAKLNGYLLQIMDMKTDGELRGIEGVAASAYFDAFDEMILNGKETFTFRSRNRRPPTDPVNAMLSFAYTLLTNDCTAALEGVGLDPYVGFMHTDRPGRASLALDLMEELRPSIADRFVLTQINNRTIAAKDFVTRENGAVRMTDEARKGFLKAWQERKKEEITHPFLKEKMPWGMVPHVQSLLLARYLRGDIDGYPPFLWK